MGQEPESSTPGGQEPSDTPTTPDPKPAAKPPAASGQEPAAGDEPQTFDREYVEKLRSEAAGNRKAAQEAQAKLTEFEDRDKSEAEKAKARADRAEKAQKDAESKLLRYEVAAEKKVPADAVELLTGSTREELEAQADKVLGLAKQAGDEAADFDGGARKPAPEQKDPGQAHNEALAEMLGLKKQTTE